MFRNSVFLFVASRQRCEITCSWRKTVLECNHMLLHVFVHIFVLILHVADVMPLAHWDAIKISLPFRDSCQATRDMGDYDKTRFSLF